MNLHTFIGTRDGHGEICIHTVVTRSYEQVCVTHAHLNTRVEHGRFICFGFRRPLIATNVMHLHSFTLFVCVSLSLFCRMLCLSLKLVCNWILFRHSFTQHTQFTYHVTN